MHKSFYEATKTPQGLNRVLELIKADYEGRLEADSVSLKAGAARFDNQINAYRILPTFRPYTAAELIERIGRTVRGREGMRFTIRRVIVDADHVDVVLFHLDGLNPTCLCSPQALLDGFTHEDGSPLGVPL